MNEAKEKMELKDKILNAAYGKVSVTPGCVKGDSEAIQAAITKDKRESPRLQSWEYVKK